MMPRPTQVFIPHDDYRFDIVGTFADSRKFMAFVTGAYPGKKRLAPANWLDVKRWIAVIHVFNADGSHLKSEARFIGLAREEPELYAVMDTRLGELLADYGITANLFGGIWIQPFCVVIDDIYYELVYERDEEGDKVYEQAALYPNDVVFYPPWDDGRYDT